MKNYIIFLTILLLAQNTASAISSSVSYKMTTEVVNGGAALGSSTSFRLEGKARERVIDSPASSSFIIGAGFMKSAYFSAPTPVLSPVVTSLTPNSGLSTGPLDITNLAGANFQTGTTVKLTKSGQTDISATEVTVVASNKITCTFDLTGAAAGLWEATVTNPDGRSGSLPSAFTVAFAAPTVISITPARGNNNGAVNITDLAGTNFRVGAIVRLTLAGESDIVADNVLVASASQITCRFDLTGKAVGLWNVSVTNNDNQTGLLQQGFKIETPSIAIVGPVANTPNPFNPGIGTTSISYNLTKDANINIYIYNMRGERVWQKLIPAGTAGGQVGLNQGLWNGVTDFNATASFGVYIVTITTPDGGGVRELGKTKIAIIK